MNDLARATAAEALRLRRTLAVTVALAAPGFAGVVALLIGSRRKNPLPEGADGWLALFESVWPLWTLMMLPLLITAITALMSQIEHQSSAFKQLYATPTARWAVYAAKLLVGTALAALASLAAATALVAVGYILRAARGEMHPLPASPPLAAISELTLAPLAASLALVALHLWIGMRFRSFAVAVSVGILGTFSALAFMGAEEGFWWPWLLPMYAMPGVRPAEDAMFTIPPTILGPLAWFVLGALGCWRVTRRDVLG